MGANFSDLKEIEENYYFNKFFQQEEILSPDPFWNQFLSFPYIPNYFLEENEIISSLLLKKVNDLHQNNTKLENLFNLINVFLLRSDELKRSSECISILSKDSIFLKQIHNSLIIIRYLIKILVELEKLTFFIGQESINCQNFCLLKKLCSTMLSISVEVPINDATYFVHLEIILILNIMLNCDLYCESASILQDLLFDEECISHSQSFIKRLLENVAKIYSHESIIRLDQENQPDTDNVYVGNLWRIISFGYFGSTTRATADKSVDYLSSECVFLILKLCLYSKFKECYTKALKSLYDPSIKNIKSSCNENWLIDSTLEISFSSILNIICSNFEEEQFVLLFYLLIHKNIYFRTYLLSQENFKDIILPLIKLIYNYSSENSNFVYMALIILLVMTETSYFNSTIHREIIDYLHWIKEKTITNISIGSLIVWILCRTIQFNFGHIGDRYIHINCLAALANMSSKFINLHPLASEQIMILLNILLKRKLYLSNNLKNITENHDCEKFSNLSNNLSVIEEIIQMLVEIINTALIFSLNNNPHMIHTFLYHKKLFSQLKINSHTETHICNIDAILTYFSSKIEKEIGKSVSSQNEVLKVIKKFSPSINKLNNFKRFPELKFKYIEQESSDDFFVPYIWKLICKNSLIFFKQKVSNLSNIC